MLARLEELDTVSTTHQDRNQELVKANEALLAKYDTAFNEQSALEAELEAANDRVDRLRNQIADAERLTRQGHRRYADQVREHPDTHPCDGVCAVLTPYYRKKPLRPSALFTMPSFNISTSASSRCRPSAWRERAMESPTQRCKRSS